MIKDETMLQTAARHVAEARRIVAQQRARIEWLKALGGDIADAERLLTTFVITLGSLEHHERSLQETVNRCPATPPPSKRQDGV